MSDQLRLLSEFQNALADYHPSEGSKQLLGSSLLVIMHAPTSVGRHTIAEKLLESGKYHYAVQETTDDAITEGRSVHKSEEEMLATVRAGDYLEVEIIDDKIVSGINASELGKAKELDKIPLANVDLSGVESIIKHKADATAIYVLPPNFDVWMERLTARAELDQSEIRRLLLQAEQVLEKAIKLPYFTFVINDDLEQAVSEIRSIVEEGRIDEKQHERGEQVAWDILGQLKQQINT
ncbi:MAG: hypothetical protein R3313_00615 [Candidatus Saccharimonadales bacterium]|nr:hypothetical protein [Candidatus Saccharimonadales bacterium]